MCSTVIKFLLSVLTIFRGSSMVERLPVKGSQLSDESLIETFRDIGEALTGNTEGTPISIGGAVETRYRKSVKRNLRIRYSPRRNENYGLRVRRWFQVRVLAAEH